MKRLETDTFWPVCGHSKGYADQLIALTSYMADSSGTTRSTETGVGIGLVLGVALDDLPVGIEIGFVLGAAVGRSWENRQE